MKIFSLFITLAALLPVLLFSQENKIGSRNGELVPVKGTLRVLLVFVEVQYPDGKDKFASTVGDQWIPGSYPVWANDLFDTYVSDNPKGVVTRYYYESSFGDLNIVADILLNPDNPSAPFQYQSNGELNVANIVNAAWEKGFRTNNSMPADSFDLWKKTVAGEQKMQRADGDPLYFDHIMVIARNCTYPGNLAGYASGGNLSAKGPVKTDTYSVFATRNGNPLNILIHEYNHLMLGGNNVHC